MTAAVVLLAGSVGPVLCPAEAKADPLGFLLRDADLLAMTKSADGFLDAVPAADRFDLGKVVAFEENKLFVYVRGAVEGGGEEDHAPARVRRLFFLKPATFVVDDQVLSAPAKGRVRWRLNTEDTPEVDGRRFRIAREKGQLTGETLLPEKAILKIIRPGDAQKQKSSVVEVLPQAGAAEHRFLHVLRLGGPDEDFRPSCKLVKENNAVQLTVLTKQRTFELTLPSGEEAGTIAVAKADGESILPRRLLPSGVLPHGAEGARLLERWDGAYRGGKRPGWDVGRPATELKKVVEDGTIRPGRAVVLGCGTGTNAIYLAQQGFDVTAIDIAPTALARAQQKADKAEVKVRWVLADVLATPQLGPFDFVFDRGCYHGVRRHSAKGYVETLRKLTRGGTRALILAGNANEERHYGPPRVKEEELRGDFSESFDFERLKEIRFDGRDSTGKGPLAWSILLRRKGEPDEPDKADGASFSEPCITDPTKQPVVIDAGKIPRFAADSPFGDDDKAPTIEKEKRLWAGSWLWAKAPKLEVEEWLTDKPQPEGKYVLIEFWATWCPPCRRTLELLNGLHRKFGKELVVIGISEEPAEDVRQLNAKHPEAPEIEFHCAVDTQKRMKDRLGVFGIPHVIILEPDGYVVWEGFPLQEGFALTEDLIERILAVGRKLRAKGKAE